MNIFYALGKKSSSNLYKNINTINSNFGGCFLCQQALLERLVAQGASTFQTVEPSTVSYVDGFKVHVLPSASLLKTDTNK